MMLLNLLKKDILISKKYVLLVSVIAFLIPIFVAWRSPHISGVLSFALSVIFSEFMLCQNLSMKESQYSKANALICSTPYPRYGIVISKYILFLGVYMYCFIAYCITLAFMPKIGKLDIVNCLSILVVISIFYGVYLPIQYRLGYEQTKLFFIAVIMSSPFFLPALDKYSSVDISVLYKYPSLVINSFLICIAFIVLFVSALFSIKIFNQEELI